MLFFLYLEIYFVSNYLLRWLEPKSISS